MTDTKHTPIEKWIEENEYPKVLCFKLLVYLGLQDIPNPAEWVEKAKIMFAHKFNPNGNISIEDYFQCENDCDKLETQIEQLQSENERLKAEHQDIEVYQNEFNKCIKENNLLLKEIAALKAEINNRLTPFKNLIAMIENGLLKGSIETHELVHQEINQCKAELKQLK